MTFTNINKYIYMIIWVFILYYAQICISIKKCANRGQFFTLNYGDFIAWSFETYRTQRQVIAVYGSIDLNVLDEDNRNKYL